MSTDKARIDWAALVAEALKSSKGPNADYSKLIGNVVNAAFRDRDERDEDHAWDMFAAEALSWCLADGASYDDDVKQAADIADLMLEERRRRQASRAPRATTEPSGVKS